MKYAGKPLLFLAIIWTSIGLTVLPHAANAAPDIRALRSGLWAGGVWANDDGSASACALAAQDPTDEYLIFFLWRKTGFHMMLYGENWKLNKGEEFKSRVKVDRRFDALVEANIPRTQIIDYSFGFDESAWRAIQAGNRISLEGPAGKKSFRLNGTRKAINVILDCADEYFSPNEEPKQDKVETPAVSQDSAYDTG